MSAMVLFCNILGCSLTAWYKSGSAAVALSDRHAQCERVHLAYDQLFRRTKDTALLNKLQC